MLFHSGERSDEIAQLELPCRHFAFALIGVFLQLFECSSDDSYLFFKQSGLNTGDSSLKYIFSVCFNPLNRRSIHIFFPPPFAELPENWTDTRETILEGMTFNLRHLGMTLVDQPKGEELSAAAVKRIVATVRAGVKKCSDTHNVGVFRSAGIFAFKLRRIKSFQSRVLIWWIFFNVASTQFV